MISKLPTYEDFERKMYYVANSDIHGEGVFSVEDLPEGTVIGRMHTKNGDNNYDFTELGEKHNHSNNPNCENMWIGNSRYMVTSKDIKSGEELVTNYRLQPDLEQPESFMESKDEYKDIEFGYGSSDGMFDYWYPDLSSVGIKTGNKEKEQTYIATNKKRHLHIQLHKKLQKKGLAEKIIKAFIYREGYRIIPKGRITNPNMLKVLDKIDADPKFSVSDEGNYYLIEEI